VEFRFSEAEVNRWAAAELKGRKYTGIETATFKFFDGNYVSTLSRVDFDQVQKWQHGALPRMVTMLLNGRRTVWVDFRFASPGGGQIALRVEKAFIDGVSVPAGVANAMLAAVAYAVDEPNPTELFDMPIELDRIWTAGRHLRGVN
jgi:hypothetical protein